jgi:hypothetical protein
MAVSPLATAVSRGTRHIDELMAAFADEVRAAVLKAGEAPMTAERAAQVRRDIDDALDRLYGPQKGHGGALAAAVLSETTRSILEAQRAALQPVEPVVKRDRLLALFLARAVRNGR